jgi:hypothetical protein
MFAAALVRELPKQRIASVRMTVMDRNDPLQDELSIILIGPHYSAMLTARERMPGRPDGGYDYRLIYDRDTVTRAASLVLQRFTRDVR